MVSLTTSILLAAPTKDSGLLEWVSYIAVQYKSIFLRATWTTLYIAIAGTLLGFLLGFVVGVINTTKINEEDPKLKKIVFRVFKFLVSIYVEIFRDTPMIVQGMVIYYGLRQSNIMISSVGAGILVTLLNTGAYMGETVRGGIGSVDDGQREGALALGMSHARAMFYVIIPQALKNIFPEMGNTFLNNLKMTSVLNVIGVSELFLAAKTAGGSYYKYFESYIVIALVYLFLCLIFNRILLFAEKKLAGKADYELATEYLENE